MTVPELVAAVQRLGVPLGSRPNKEIADAVRWEVLRRHVRRVARGKYAVDRRQYAHDPERSYSRPDNYPRLDGGL